jgi:ATP phosphoribosyltransferase
MSTATPVTIALSKGRIFEETVPLLAAAGIEVTEDVEKSRKLIFDTNRPMCAWCWCVHRRARLRAIRRRRPGRVGLDSLIEHGGQGLYQPLDLQIAKCRVSVAVRNGFDYQLAVKQGARLRMATKYPEIARNFFAKKGVHVDMVKLYGSMELAPLTGMADAIVDLVSTGNTLKANDLVEVEPIMDISSRLVVNQASLKLKQAPLRHIIDAFAQAVAAKNN